MNIVRVLNNNTRFILYNKFRISRFYTFYRFNIVTLQRRILFAMTFYDINSLTLKKKLFVLITSIAILSNFIFLYFLWTIE